MEMLPIIIIIIIIITIIIILIIIIMIIISLLKIVKGFSDDIRMDFGLDKCAKAIFKRGKLAKTENIELDVGTAIQDLEQEGTYKYLGVNEGDRIQHAKMKEKIRKEYYCRIRLVLKSELNAVNKIDVINTLAVPVVTYSFNIINWKMEELMKLDRKTRKFLTMAWQVEGVLYN